MIGTHIKEAYQIVIDWIGESMKHNHHDHCEHVVKYCAKCDVAYCEKCNKEWRPNTYQISWTTPTYTYPYSTPTYTVGDPIDPIQITCGHSSCQ